MGNKAAVAKWRNSHPEHYKDIQVRWKQGNPDKVRFYMAKANAKRAEHSFSLTLLEYTKLVHIPCWYCHNKLGNVQVEKSGIGLDRIDNSKGYELSNVLPCCCFCNRTRGDRLTVSETHKVIDIVLEMRGIA